MKYAILTVSTPNRKRIFELTNKTKEKFASEHGMDFIFSDSFKDEIDWKGHLYWLKPFYIKKHFADYDAVFWMDDDAGFVRYDFDLSSFIGERVKPIYYTEDENGINSGIMILKKCETAQRYLDFWTSTSTDRKFQFRNYDQEALISYANDHPSDFGTLNGSVFNAHHPSFEMKARNSFSSETLIVHVAGGPGRKDALFRSGEMQRLFRILS